MRMRLTAFTLASLLLTRLTASPIQGPGTDALVLRDVESAASDDVINARGTHPLPSGKGSCGTTSNPERTVGAGALASTCEVLIAQLRNNTAHQVETTQPRWCYQNNPKDACCVQSVGNLQRFQTADYADNRKWLFFLAFHVMSTLD